MADKKKKLINIDKDFVKDVFDEQAFLGDIKKSEVDKYKTQLEHMQVVYDEQLNRLTRLRFDKELFTYLILAEPNDRSHVEKKTKTDMTLVYTRKLLEVVRRQIKTLIDVEKMADGKKN